jgi:hypothetical protein
MQQRTIPGHLDAGRGQRGKEDGHAGSHPLKPRLTPADHGGEESHSSGKTRMVE